MYVLNFELFLDFEGYQKQCLMNKTKQCSDSTRHRSRDICPPISQIVPKNFIKISLILKECPEDILIKLVIVLKISKSS